MKSKNLVVRITEEEIANIDLAYKKYLAKDGTEIVTKSEFIRKLIREGVKNVL